MVFVVFLQPLSLLFGSDDDMCAYSDIDDSAIVSAVTLLVLTMYRPTV